MFLEAPLSTRAWLEPPADVPPEARRGAAVWPGEDRRSGQRLVERCRHRLHAVASATPCELT